MKKILTLFILFLCVAGASGQALSNRLIVESKKGEKFYLRVDGFRRNKEAKSKVEVRGIYATATRITIEFEDSTYAPVKNLVVDLVPDMSKEVGRTMNYFEARYQVTAGKKKSKVKKMSIVRKETEPTAYK